MLTFDATTAARLASELEEDDGAIAIKRWCASRDFCAVTAYEDHNGPVIVSAADWHVAVAISRIRNNARAAAEQLRAALDEIERLQRKLAPLDGSSGVAIIGLKSFEEQLNERRALRAEVERLREELTASEERFAGVLDGTFSVGDGTAQREIERLRAENKHLRGNLETLTFEYERDVGAIPGLRAEIERMRVVYEAAIAYRQLFLATGQRTTKFDEAADAALAADSKERG